MDDKVEFYRAFGRRLAVLRRHLGETPEQFATRLGMTKRAYLPYELGKRRGYGVTNLVLRAGQSTGVSLDWLMAGGYPDGPKNDRRPMLRGGLSMPPKLRAVGGAS